jgi:hypothetical protein
MGDGRLRHLPSRKIRGGTQAPFRHALEISSGNYRSSHDRSIKEIRRIVTVLCEII